jgi:hypothetical protein
LVKNNENTTIYATMPRLLLPGTQAQEKATLTGRLESPSISTTPCVRFKKARLAFGKHLIITQINNSFVKVIK